MSRICKSHGDERYTTREVNMTIQAVLFDVGGVLIRTEGRTARRKWEARLGLPEFGLGRAIFGSEISARATVGQASVAQVWRQVATQFGLGDEQMHELERDFWSDDWLDAELVQFMRDLRPRCKTGLLSNAWPDARRVLSVKFGLGDAVDVMILSAEVGCAKPDARIYQIAVERLGVQWEEAVFVDDVAENVASAQALGMGGIRFEGTAQTIDEIKRYLDGRHQA
jgi:epoxide hydrolase-like predicted phosphatase